MSVHPLAAMLAGAARNRFPAFDGMVEVLPSPGPPVDALVAFTGHFVLAAGFVPVGAEVLFARGSRDSY